MATERLQLGEIIERLRRMFPGVSVRLDRFRHGTLVLALVTIYPKRHVYMDGIVPHELTGDPAKLSPWQRDNRLVGFGLASDMATATDQAIHSAARGDLDRRNLTVWFDRLGQRFRFFDRGTGDERWGETGAYRPRGEEITRATAAAMASGAPCPA